MLVPLFFMMGGGDLILGIYGAGGAGRETREMAESIGGWTGIVFIDDAYDSPDMFKNIRIMSFDSFCAEFSPGEAEVVISVGEPITKALLYGKVKAAGYKLANVIHPSAWVSPSATLGEGIIVRMGALINADAVVEDNVAFFEHAGIGHDTVVRKNAHISGNVAIGGNCEIGEETYIAMGVPVKQGCKIGARTIVGLGAVVLRDIPDDVIALGNPAKRIITRSGQKVFGKR